MPGRRPENLLAELSRLEAMRDPTRSGTHNRQFKRFVVRGDAELHPVGRARLDRAPLDITLRDVARGGMGFVCQHSLPTGSNWRVCFLQRGYVIGEQAIVVRHCRPVAEGVYLVGSQFVIDNGLLALLGIDPSAIRDEDGSASEINDESAFRFRSPSEVA